MRRLVLSLLLISLVSCSPRERAPLRVGIAPYQDIAMLVNLKNLGLEAKYGLPVQLQTMAWEDILPAVASAGTTIDVGFGSLVEYLTKERALNRGVSDPLVFAYPAYVFKGGGFATLDSGAPDLTQQPITAEAAREFLDLRIGAQKKSVYEMMLFTLARRFNVDASSLRVVDISLNDGLLALENGDLDVTAAGLTQRAEVEKLGGRVILTMESLGFADVTGFICRRSTLQNRRTDVENLIRMWFDSVDYVLMDLKANSGASLDYLKKHAATSYTFEGYSAALSQEYFPRSVSQVRETILQPEGTFSLSRISSEVVAYLLTNKVIDQPPEVPVPISLEPQAPKS